MDLSAAIMTDGAHPALLLGTALVLGALHGLEPGHSKALMAAFLIAVRGTTAQAVLLGVSAAVSHSLVVWVVALLALRFGEELVGPGLEPILAVASGALICGIAGWVFLQAWRSRPAADHAAHAQPLDHHHAHDHHGGHHHHDRGGVHNDHQDHGHAPQVHDCGKDAHARAHAAEIAARFSSGRVTLWQTLSFGLTGGLIPCSAAITVLIVCLNLGQFWLGVGLVSAFSLGLAATLVAAGMAVVIGLRFVAARGPRRLGRWLAMLPFVSAAFIGVIGVALVWGGLAGMPEG